MTVLAPKVGQRVTYSGAEFPGDRAIQVFLFEQADPGDGIVGAPPPLETIGQVTIITGAGPKDLDCYIVTDPSVTLIGVQGTVMAVDHANVDVAFDDGRRVTCLNTQLT